MIDDIAYREAMRAFLAQPEPRQPMLFDLPQCYLLIRERPWPTT